MSDSEERTPAVFSKVLTNPPFGSIMQGEIGEILGRFQLGHKKKSLPLEYIALERCLQFVRPGGTVAIVLPDGIVTNSSAQFARAWTMSQAKVRAVVSLPTETFGPFGTMTKTSVIIFQKYRKDERTSLDYPVLMASVTDVGYDATGRKSNSSDIPAVLAAWKSFNQNPTKDLDVDPKLAYVATAQDIAFRWDVKAGQKFQDDDKVIPVSEYLDVVKVTAVLEKKTNQTFPYLSISELPEDPFITSSPMQVAGGRLQGPKHIAKGGDVLFARLGPSMGNRKSLLVSPEIGVLYCSNEFIVLRPKSGVPSSFVLFLVKSDSFIAQGQAKARGATPSRLRLYSEDLLKIRVPAHTFGEMEKKGGAYLAGRTKAAQLMDQATTEIQECSPDF